MRFLKVEAAKSGVTVKDYIMTAVREKSLKSEAISQSSGSEDSNNWSSLEEQRKMMEKSERPRSSAEGSLSHD